MRHTSTCGVAGRFRGAGPRAAGAVIALSVLLHVACGRMPRSATAPRASADEIALEAPSQKAHPVDFEPQPGPRQFRGQLHAGGRWLVYPDGSRFRWRGVTGFMLNEQMSSGREADAAAFLAWASRTGFNVVRIFVMLPKGWFTDKDFTPEEGLAALPRTLALARDADMYAQVTVLVNTASLPPKTDLGSYVERAGRICADAGNCALVEVANEAFDRAQRGDVRDLGTLRRWAARVQPGIPTALGSPGTGSGAIVDSSPVIAIHLDRRPDRWTRARQVSELGTLSTNSGRFVIDNEPMGADEVEQPRQWENAPEVFFAQGALSRIFEVGSNFHFEDGRRATAPRPIQQQCAEAFIAGTRIVDDSYMLTPHDAGGPYSPVQKSRAVAAYAGLTQVFPAPSGPSSVVLLLGVEGDPGVVWLPPWEKRGVIAALPHVQAWWISRVSAGR